VIIENSPPSANPPPSSPELFRIWLSLGLQSFGGGTATLALIRRAAVERHRWLTEAEFARFWSLVQLAPGINLVCLTILIGRRISGTKGIALALAGLLLPSAAVTVLLTAFYQHVQNAPLVRDALHGILPATVGLGLVTAWQIARPPLARSYGEGRRSFGVGLALLLGSAAALQWVHLPVLVILLGAGGVGAAWEWGRRRAQEKAR
jgi:chromate transporter